MRYLIVIVLLISLAGCVSQKYVAQHRFVGMTFDEFFDIYGKADWPPAPTNYIVKDYNSHSIFTPTGVIRRSTYRVEGNLYRVYWKQDTNWEWRVISEERLKE